MYVWYDWQTKQPTTFPNHSSKVEALLQWYENEPAMIAIPCVNKTMLAFSENEDTGERYALLEVPDAE